MQNYNALTQQFAGLCFDFNDCMTQDEGLAGWTTSGSSAVSGGSWRAGWRQKVFKWSYQTNWEETFMS